MEDGMVDVVDRRCGHRDCNKQPRYGKKGSRKAERCAEHAEDGMVDVVSKRCEYDGCDKHPKYGKVGRKKVACCFAHAEDGMVSVVHKRCGNEGCNERPSYSSATGGSRSREFCTQHSKERMVCLSDGSQSTGEAGTSRGSGQFGSTGGGVPPGVGAGEKRRLGALPSSQTGASSSDQSGGSKKRARQSPDETPATRIKVEAVRRESLLQDEDQDCLSAEPGSAVVKAEVSVDSKMDLAGASRVEAVGKKAEDHWTTPAEDGLRSELAATVKPDVEFAFPSGSKSPGGKQKG